MRSDIIGSLREGFWGALLFGILGPPVGSIAISVGVILHCVIEAALGIAPCSTSTFRLFVVLFFAGAVWSYVFGFVPAIVTGFVAGYLRGYSPSPLYILLVSSVGGASVWIFVRATGLRSLEVFPVTVNDFLFLVVPGLFAAALGAIFLRARRAKDA
jgi:hypothetical protein